MALTNLVSIQSQSKKVRSLSQSIEVILTSFAHDSKNTARSYRTAYKEFFLYTVNKSLDAVSWDDLLSITYDMVAEYIGAISVTNKAKTIQAKMGAVQSLYKELYKINRDVDVLVLDVKLPKTKKEKSASYGSLTLSEVEALLEYCDTLSEIQKPLVKKLFFKTAFITAIRKSALLSLTWDDIEREYQDNAHGIWVINVDDKTGVDKTPISDDFYDELLELKQEDSNKVFNINEKSLVKTLNQFCDIHGIADSRNIVIHSLKKASMDRVFNETRDITATASHGHHAGIEMSYKNYLGKNNDLTNRPSYYMFNEANSVDALKDLSKEELLEIILACPENVAFTLLGKAKELKLA